MRTEIRSHTGLRGVAALMVVAYHLQFTQDYRLPLETATLLFKRSYLMVDLFFILSGFVLSYVYKEQLDYRSFFRARFARIYPLHVFALLCLTTFALSIWFTMSATGRAAPELGNLSDWFRQLILLNAWFPAATEWNMPSWSISAEAFAYLLFPILLARLRSAAVQAIAILLIFVFYLSVGRNLDFTWGIAVLRCLAGFALGMLLFRYRKVELQRISAMQVAAVTWIFVSLAFPVPDALVIPGFAGLVFLTWQDRGLVARWLSCAPLHWLGTISYSVYLMHYTVGAVLSFLWFRVRFPGDPAFARGFYLCLVFGCVLIVSHLTYRFVERPGQRKLRGQSKPTAVAAP